MRYLVRARVKPGREGELLHAIEDGTLGQGSVAEGEYLRNMQEARLCADQTVRWVEVCYCPTPLRSEEHTSELQSQSNLVCRLLLATKQRQAAGRLVSAEMKYLPLTTRFAKWLFPLIDRYDWGYRDHQAKRPKSINPDWLLNIWYTK